MTSSEVVQAIQGRLIVSCQPGEGDFFLGPQLMARFVAAVAGRAAAIRADGPADVRAIREKTGVPIIGIHKIRHHDGASGDTVGAWILRWRTGRCCTRLRVCV